MKTIIITILSLIATSASFAQITPGSYLIGGDFGFGFGHSPTSSTVQNTTNFNISPSLGKFVSDKYLISGGIGYTYFGQSIKNDGTDFFNKSTSNGLSLQFGVTRYIPLKDRLYFTVGANLSPAYSLTTSETTQFGLTTNSTSSALATNLGFSGGLAYFINRKWMLYTSVGLVNYRMNYDLDTDQIGHNFSMSGRSNSFSVGLRYVIGKGTNE